MADPNALAFSVPTIASSGAPQVVNPLAAITAGNQAAAGLYDLRAKQAQQQIGDILQQATDPQTGTVDHARAQALASQAGPGVQMGMQAFLTSNSALRGSQQTQADNHQKIIARTNASLLYDSSDANVNRQADELIRGGYPAAAINANRQALLAMDENQRKQHANSTLQQLLSGTEVADRNLGTMKLEQFGNVAAPTLSIPPAPGRPGQVIVSPNATTIGPAPGSTKTRWVPVDENGVEIPLDATGKPIRTPAGQRPVEQPVTAVPGIPSGGQPVGGAGGGAPAQALPPNTNVPQGTQPGRIAPAPGSPTRNPAVVPAAPAVTTNTPAPFFTSPPQQQPERLAADVKAYTEDKAAIPTVRTRAENAGHAYDALQVLKLNTGRGAEGIGNVRSFLRTVGMLPPGTVKDTDVMDIFNKYTERAMIEAAGGGGTDLGRQMATQASPGKSLGTGANLEIIRNDLGKTLQTIAANNSHDPNKQGAEYLDHRSKIALTTDPRGFVWNMYSPEEQKQILNSVKDDPVADFKLHRAIGMASDPKLGLSVPVSRPPQRKQSFLAPPMMPGPQPNALHA